MTTKRLMRQNNHEQGHHTHNGTLATTATKHPPGPTRQSIYGQGASRTQRNPSNNGGKASAGRGHHTHSGAQVTTMATPNIRTR
jgi:hypothetical protein